MKGKIELRPFHARSLVGNPLADPVDRTLTLYLPPGYEQSAARFPSIYFLHGFTGSGAGWLSAQAWSPTVPERLDLLIDSGQVPPFIGVFVDGWTSLGGSQWLNSEAVGNHRDHLAKDVVTWVDTHLRTVATAKARAIVGKSSGGYGALVMGRHHPDIWGHIGSHSGDCGFEYCYLSDFPKAASALLAAGGVEAWFQAFLERGRATRLKGEDHTVINTLAMAAAYSPSLTSPLRLELPFDLATARLLPNVWNRWLEHDPVRFIPRSAQAFQKLSSVFLDCGTRDEFNLRWGARMVKEALEAVKVEVLHEEFEDGHMGINYRFDQSVRYLAPRLDA